MKLNRKKIKYIFLGLAAVSVLYACSKKYLQVAPVGSVDPNLLANETGVNGLLVGAYSLLDGEGGNNGGWGSAISNWVYGSVVADEAYKGSTPDDQGDIVPLETWSANAANSYPSQKWDLNYDGVQRANAVIRTLALATDVPADEATQITAEARFLRAFYHFELKKVFGNVPYIGENVTDTTAQANVSNVAGTGYVNIWPQIEADFSFAMTNLPATQAQVGRANKYAAEAMLAKVYLYEAKYDDAKPLFDDLIANGQTSDGLKYDLVKFGANFNPGLNHLKDAEAVFSVQMSVNDGSGDAQNVSLGISNGNYGDALNFPYGAGPGACCGFFNPSQDLANAYKTDPATGLPMPTSYNSGANVDSATGPYTGTLDPRIDWTIGRKNVPYLDWGPHPGDTWIRDPVYDGHFNPKKNVYASSQKGTLSSTEAFWAATELVANNVNVIRYADVLLMAAEVYVKSSTPDLTKALTYVNMVRARAADKTGWVYAGTSAYDASSSTYAPQTVPAANYKIGLYTSFASATDAMTAIMFERRLELGMEGHRFFDLVRWGIAAQVLNAYSAYSYSIGLPQYKGVTFTAGKYELFPIPQDQIDILKSSGTEYLKQNPGY